jgi:hypothetical protein
MRQTTVGAMIEKPHLQKHQKLYGAQERLHITSMLGGTHALKTYVFRVRYRANNGAWWTDYSEWSNSICMPDRSLLTLLENCDKTAGLYYNFKRRLNEFCSIGLTTGEDLLQCAVAHGLDQALVQANTALEYQQRRTLIRVLRAQQEGVSFEEYDFRYRYGKEAVVEMNSCKRMEMYTFLYNLNEDDNPHEKGKGLEQYVELMFRLVDSAGQLLHCYTSKEEFLDDVRESCPSMKPAHRRIVWLGIKRATSKNVCCGTSEGSSGTGSTGSSSSSSSSSSRRSSKFSTVASVRK